MNPWRRYEASYADVESKYVSPYTSSSYTEDREYETTSTTYASGNPYEPFHKPVPSYSAADTSLRTSAYETPAYRSEDTSFRPREPMYYSSSFGSTSYNNNSSSYSDSLRSEDRQESSGNGSGRRFTDFFGLFS